MKKLLYLLALALLLCGCGVRTDPQPTTQPVTQPPTTEPAPEVYTGFLAAPEATAEYYDDRGVAQGALTRGAQVEYILSEEGAPSLYIGGRAYALQADATIVTDMAQVIPGHTLYVRTAVNLRTAEGRLMEAFAQKGAALTVTGCDYVDADGAPHMYRVQLAEQEGYILPWYVTAQQQEAISNYDAGSYHIHADRGNRYGGGDGASLDYFPREKGELPGNPMPRECRTLYLVSWKLDQVDSYIALAQGSGINAFVVDITDGGSIGYAGEVMRSHSPASAAAAHNTPEDYKAAVQKLKAAGYYVIGRITTFNDTRLIQDHPEYAICDTAGAPLRLSGEHWPSPYCRAAWQYKVDLAVEAVELMGFNEIQFDYVRFPDSTYRYDSAGTIDYRNTYGETKAQAIQRFLMYATDILHEHGAYVSADVYGESAFTYVTAYGQYWPAVSNVVDAISGMPYPDHFGAQGDWLPWEHPYELLLGWGESVMARQAETATPAAVRTWIQAYNAIRPPYNTYGPDEVGAQIRALRDAGCAGGFMTWNSASSLDKYASLVPAFAPPEG